MKKSLSRALSAILAAVLLVAVGASFVGCGKNASSSEKEDKTITVGASATPHAEILNSVVKEQLAAKGYELKVVVYNDYVIPNTAVDNGEIDANYFQHITYMNDFNASKGTKLKSVAEIHYEPFGIFGGKAKSLSDLGDGTKVAVPNDATNEARALLLLEAQGLIKLKDNAGLKATKVDIVENPKNLDIVEIEAAQLTRSLNDVDIACINGNYAIEGGLKIADALATESKDSEASKAYANVVAVKEGNESQPKIQALVEAIKSDKTKDFINEKYSGAVVPVF